jgi:hypothetical protein
MGVAKLTKPQIKAHKEAEALIACERPLTDDEKEFVLDNWQESANHINSAAGAFFTPRSLAGDFAIEVDGSSLKAGTLIDLCAGIGSLTYAVAHRFSRIVCVEINAEYARIGKRIVPEAEWLVCSAFDPRVLQLGRFAWAISNPPFGKIKAADYEGPYTGSEFEYRVIEVASRIADYGAFILPQMSAPFRLSGQQCFTEDESDKARKFRQQTGIILEPGCGVDTSIYRNEWRGVAPACEIVVCEFERPETEVANEVLEAAQPDLFAEAA